jgi:hypothetical protein
LVPADKNLHYIESSEKERNIQDVGILWYASKAGFIVFLAQLCTSITFIL